MTQSALAVTVLVATLHLCFWVLEMFFWRKPLGLKTFRMDPAFAERSASLAANMGLYNGFLAAGLLFSLSYPEPHGSVVFTRLFLTFALVAGLYGAATANKRILWVQAMPAALALGLNVIATLV